MCLIFMDLLWWALTEKFSKTWLCQNMLLQEYLPLKVGFIFIKIFILIINVVINK